MERNNPIYDYFEQLSESLQINDIIDKLEKLFAGFSIDHNTKSEIDFLRTLKLFFFTNKSKITNITKGSIIKNYDCLTLSIIGYFLAKKKGFNIKIGRVNSIPKYFHAGVIMSNGNIYRFTKKQSSNKSLLEFSVDKTNKLLDLTKITKKRLYIKGNKNLGIILNPDEILIRLKTISPMLACINNANKKITELFTQ